MLKSFKSKLRGKALIFIILFTSGIDFLEFGCAECMSRRVPKQPRCIRMQRDVLRIQLFKLVELTHLLTLLSWQV